MTINKGDFIMNITFDHYKVFYFVASRGSITRAAKALFISQPAVSKSIQHLELELSCELFHRNQKGMALTPEGEMLFGHVSKAYEQLILGEKKLWEMLNLNDGVVRLGTSDMIARFYLLPYLETFHNKYPQIRINMQSGTTPGTRQALLEERIEVGIVTSPVDVSGEMAIYPVRDIQDIFVAGSHYGHLQDRVMDFETLLSYPVICTEKHTASRHYLDAFFFEQKLRLDPAFELGTTELIIPYVKQNLGIGISLKDAAEEGIKDGSIIEIKTSKSIPKREICVIIRKNGKISKASEAFLKAILDKG